MNPAFVIIVIGAAIAFWFTINSVFPKVGSILYSIFEETKYNMSEDEDNKEEEN